MAHRLPPEQPVRIHPAGHRQGRGADYRVLAVLGREPFRDDVLASGGLDDLACSP